MSLTQGKQGLMHERKVSFKISLCSPQRQMRDIAFCLNWLFPMRKLPFNKKYHKSGKSLFDCAD